MLHTDKNLFRLFALVYINIYKCYRHMLLQIHVAISRQYTQG
jgi:hypothetical protein